MNDACANISATPKAPPNTTLGWNGASEKFDTGTALPKRLNALRTVIMVTSSVMNTPSTFAPECTPCTPSPRQSTSAPNAYTHQGIWIPSRGLINSEA